MEGDEDFLSRLQAAGMSPSLLKKLKEHQIDKELFTLMKVGFMRDVLELSGYEILEMKKFQSKKLVVLSPVENRLEQQSPAKTSNVTTSPHRSEFNAEELSSSDSTPTDSAKKKKGPAVKPRSSKQSSSQFSTRISMSEQAQMDGPSSSSVSGQKSVAQPGTSKASSSTKHQNSSKADNRSLSSDSESNSDKENSNLKEDLLTEEDVDAAVKAFKADPEPAFASLKQSLPKFDIISILHKEMRKAHNRFKANFIELLQKKHLGRTKRLVIIRKLTGYLYLEYASSPMEVTPSMKEGMAKSFCVIFPKFANLDDKHQPWSPVFSPKGPAGYIANASRPFMKANRKRPAKAQKRKALETKDSDMDDDDIKALGLINEGRNEKPEVLNGMEKCFAVRETERGRGESITFFMNKYPQFGKYKGEILSEEFKRLRPDAEDMCRTFLKFLPKILALNLKREVNLPITDDGVKALIILSQHLPHDIPKRNEKVNQSWAVLKDIIVVLEPSDSIDEYVAHRIAKSNGCIQPYLIFVRGQVDKNRIMRIFIVLDAQKCEVDTTSSIKGIDWLFKCYFIFNVCYPFGWRSTLHFLQTCFYKIFEHQGRKKDKVNASEFELWQKLREPAS